MNLQYHLGTLGLGLALVSSSACDVQSGSPEVFEGVCLPQDGCDGIASVFEVRTESTSQEAPTSRRPHWCVEDDEFGVSYAATESAACDVVGIECEAGWQVFSDACGCGCAFVGSEESTVFRGAIGPIGPWCMYDATAC